MEVALDEVVFSDFGDDPLFPFARTGLFRVEGDTPQELRTQIKQFCPRCPGVYGMLDRLGRLIYVGKSKSLRNRLMSYFLPHNEEDKAGRIVQSSCAIVWEPQPSEFAALLREQYLIRNFQPRFNVQGLPKRQQPIFICLGRAPAEQLYTTRRDETKALVQLGPLFGAGRANRAVEVLNRLFKLRDCGSKQPCSFTDQLQLFDIELRPGCIRLEIATCLGPCISACSRGAYESQVVRAQAFLEGSDESVLDELEQAMRIAAQKMHFEQAAVLREDWKAVRWLYRRASDLARARQQYTFVYPVKGTSCHRTPGKPSSNFDIWYLIRRGIIEAAVAAPQTDEELKKTEKLINLWLNQDQYIGGSFSPRSETLALVTSWFRNTTGEIRKTFLPEACMVPNPKATSLGRAKPRAQTLQSRPVSLS